MQELTSFYNSHFFLDRGTEAMHIILYFLLEEVIGGVFVTVYSLIQWSTVIVFGAAL